MYTVNTCQQTEVEIKSNGIRTIPLVIDTTPDRKLDMLLAKLAPETPWGERQNAARKLGYMRDPEALPGLLAALPSDPFWMVRCAIVQALEIIGDSGAIPTLCEVAKNDGFQVVRSYAAKAIERIGNG